MAEGVTIKITGEDGLQLMFDWFIERFRSGKVPIGEACDYAKSALAVYDMILKRGGNNPLHIKDIPTCVLMNELKSRDGVETIEAEPYKPFCVSGEGPAVVIVVKDIIGGVVVCS